MLMMASRVLLIALIVGKIQDSVSNIIWDVQVRTSRDEDAGTDDDVYLKIIGPKGETKPIFLNSDRDDNNRGGVDDYTFKDTKDVGFPIKLNLRNTGSDEWKPDKVLIRPPGSTQWRVFIFVTFLHEDEQVTVPKDNPCDEFGHEVINDKTSRPGPWNKCLSEACRDCDIQFQPRWYRFQINGTDVRMPTSCPNLDDCTSYAPMWLDLSGQQFPKVDRTEVVTKACVSSEDGCCVWSTSVTIHKCPIDGRRHFFIYKLGSAPICYFRYCNTVDIVSPDPIVLGAPMEVNCSVATIGGVQKLPGIDGSFLIQKLSIYQKTRDGVYNHIAQLDTLPSQSKTHIIRLPKGVTKNDITTSVPQGKQNNHYAKVLQSYITMKVVASLELAMAEYLCRVEYRLDTDPKSGRHHIISQKPSIEGYEAEDDGVGKTSAWAYVMAVLAPVLVVCICAAIYFLCFKKETKRRKRRYDSEESYDGGFNLKEAIKGRFRRDKSRSTRSRK